MTIKETSSDTHTPEPDAIIRLTPRLRVLDGVSPDIDPRTQKPEGKLLTAVSHRFKLTLDPEVVAANPTIFEGRENETHYVYRRHPRQDTAVLWPDILGNTERGSYGVPTRQIVRDWRTLSSFFTHSGEWVLASFPEATQTPPETLLLPRQEKPQTRRRLMPPRRHTT